MIILPFFLLVLRASAQDFDCASPAEELQRNRTLAARRFIALQLGGGASINLTRSLQSLEETFSRSAVFTSSIVDTITGPQSLFLSIYLLDPEVNGGYLNTSAPVILNTSLDEDAVDVSVQVTFTAMSVGESANFTSSWHFDFFNCSDTIDRIEETGLDSALGFVFQKDPQSLDPVRICSLINGACPGGLFPFSSVLDCLNYMRSIPSMCASDVRASLVGDTAACRLRWAASARLDPMGSCKLVSADSPACMGDSCTIFGSFGNYTEPVPVAGVNSSLYGSVPILVVAFLVAFVPAVAYLYLIFVGFFRIRRKVRVKLNLSGSVTQVGRKLQRQQPTFVRATPGLAARDLVLEIPQRTLLQRMSFYFAPGSFVGVMGASGAGKSSLLKLISGKCPREAKQSGDLLLVRRNHTAEPLFACGEPIGYVEQHVSDLAGTHPELTVQESLMCHALMVIGLSRSLPRVVHDDPEQWTITMVQDVVQAMSLQRVLHRKMRFLSGGEQKRWRLARELLERPSMLLVDEGTSGLDSEAALELTRSLKDLTRNGVTTIMTVHQPRNTILGLLDSVLVLSFGGRVAVLGEGSLLSSRLTDLKTRYLSSICKASAGKAEHGWMEKSASEYLVSAFWRQDSSMDGRVCAMPQGNGSEGSGQVDDSGDGREGLSLDEVLILIRSAWMGSARCNGNGLSASSCMDTASMLDVMRGLAVPQSPPGYGSESLHLIMASLVEEIEWMLEEGHEGLPPLLAGDSLGDVLTALCEHRRPVTLLLPSMLELLCILDSLTVDCDSKPLIGERMNKTCTGGFSNTHRRFKQSLTIQQIIGWQYLKGLGLGIFIPSLVGQFFLLVLICMLFPFLSADSMTDIFKYEASLLLFLLGLVDFGSLAVIGVFVTSNTFLSVAQRKDSLGNYLPSVAASIILMMMGYNVVTTLVHGIIYIFIVGWNVNLTASNFFTMISSFKIYLDCGMIVQVCARLSLGLQAGRDPGALWAVWNAIFSGRIAQFNHAFVIWRYWAFYVTPMYNIINVWVWSTFYSENTLGCKPREPVEECPPIGSLVLDTAGYSAISSGTSLLLLLVTWIIYILFYAATCYTPRLNAF